MIYTEYQQFRYRPHYPLVLPAGARAHLNADVYRLCVSIEGEGWSARLLNALAALEFGKSQKDWFISHIRTEALLRRR
jgi:hypothetical protein